MDKINSKTQKPYKKPLITNHIEFPKNRDFYFLALYDAIKDFPTTDSNDPEHMCIIFENKEKQIQENNYKRKYFINDYEFIKVIEKKSNSDINFIISKTKINIGVRENRLLTEIKIRPLLIKEINKRTQIDFNAEKEVFFKDSISVPKEFKFFNRVFYLYFVKKNSTTIQNNQKITNNNASNNILNNYNSAYINNNTNTNMNNIYNLRQQNPQNILNNNINNLNINNQNVQQNPQIFGYTGNNLIVKTNNDINQINIGNHFNNVNGQNNQNISFNKIGNLNTAQINNQINYIENQTNLIDNSEKKNETEKNLEGTNNNIQQEKNQQNIPKLNYIFSKRGLKNIGSTCYMNATLQCLLHVSELVIYFLQEYEKDKLILNEKNKNIESKGKISEAFFNLVKGVNEESIKDNNNYNNNPYDKAFAPVEFKIVLGNCNPQFRRFEANDSKDLILYLLQTMHDEMNYYGDINKRLNYNPNQYNLNETYNHFVTNYNTNNFSKISLLFYGTYINSTTCFTCKKILYNFQKFEFISFSMENYNRKKFNILQGFQDNSSPNQLKGDNKLFCNNCNKLQEGETTCKIFEPPQNLLINIDYGINKIYQPSFTEFDEEIDITNFVVFDYKQKIRYRIIGVCTHYGYSGSSGHYVAFCKNKENNTWYEFNDSFCSECDKKEIYRGSPYLLLYEREFNN